MPGPQHGLEVGTHALDPLGADDLRPLRLELGVAVLDGEHQLAPAPGQRHPDDPPVVRIGGALDVARLAHLIDQLGGGLLAGAEQHRQLRRRRRPGAGREQHEPVHRADIGPAALAETRVQALDEVAEGGGEQPGERDAGGIGHSDQGGAKELPSASVARPPTGRQQSARRPVPGAGCSSNGTPGGTTMASPGAARRALAADQHVGGALEHDEDLLAGELVRGRPRAGIDLDEPHAGLGRPAARGGQRGEAGARDLVGVLRGGVGDGHGAPPEDRRRADDNGQPR